jgi:Zn-dependent peptidase ImmA (M78 family)
MSKRIIPLSVNIMGTQYTVKREMNLASETNVLYGHVDYENQLIKINDRLNTVRQTQVLMHESVHAISNELDINLDESQVSKLTLGFITFIKNNPEFITTTIMR